MEAAGISVAERIEEIPKLIQKRIALQASAASAQRGEAERSHQGVK